MTIKGSDHKDRDLILLLGIVRAFETPHPQLPNPHNHVFNAPPQTAPTAWYNELLLLSSNTTHTLTFTHAQIKAEQKMKPLHFSELCNLH